MPPERCSRKMLESGGAAITCLVVVLLSLHVSADSNLPFDSHIQPCSYWPDQDWDGPCQCYTSCLGTPGSIYLNGKQSGIRDIAFNRPTAQSSYWVCTWGETCICSSFPNIFPSCGVVNGYMSTLASSGCNWYPANCINTDHSDYSAFWYVDFQRPYTVSLVRLLHRNWSVLTGRIASQTELVDSEECHSWPGYAQSALVNQMAKNVQLDFTCTNPIRGRFFRIQKRPDRNANYNDVIIDLCEVQVWACTTGTWGRLGLDNTCRSCSSCPFFCDNYYGCTVSANVTNNAAVRRFDALFSSHGDTAHYPLSSLVDGVSPTVQRDFSCWRSLSSQSLPKFVRVQLDGIWLLVSVRLSSYIGEENSPVKYTVVTTRRVTNVRAGRQDDDVVCWELDGTLGIQFEKTCTSCTSDDLKTCPRGIFISAVEKSRTQLNLCEMEVFGLATKEVGVGELCQAEAAGAPCGLVFCEAQQTCVDRKCLAKLGTYCQTRDDCLAPGQCSPSSRVCKLPINNFCLGLEHLCMETLVCDAFIGLCKRDLGEACAEVADCFNRYVCDHNKVCRNPVGSECSIDILCVAGAMCHAEKSECQCKEPFSLRNGSKCFPNDDCSPAGTCREGMTCNEKRKCRCLAPTVAGQTFECRVPAGGNCVPNAKGAGQCVEGTECNTKSHTCQAAVNARCDPTAQPSQCDTQRTMCDATFNRCLVIPGKPCSGSAPCASGYICQERDSTCHVRALGACEHYPQWCVDDYECVTVNGKKQCLLKSGGECNDHIQEGKCQESAKCLWDFEGITRCVQDVGQPCSGTLMCREGARCSQDNTPKCFWMPASSCDPSKKDECGPDQICDVDKVCRIKKGKTCGYSNETYCQLRTHCVNNMCVCDTSITKESQKCTFNYESLGLAYAPCVPCKNESSPDCVQCAKAGRATCQNKTGDKLCICTEGYEADQHYKCKPGIGSRCEEPKEQTEDNIVCARNATCFENKCAIQLDQPCFGHTSNCKTGLRCDSNYLCKVNLGFACNTTDQCFGKYVCDPLAKKCKLVVNSSCQTDIECVAGAYCDETMSRCVCNVNLTDSTATRDGRCKIRTGLPSGPSQKQGDKDLCYFPETVRPDGKGNCVCRDGLELDTTILSCKIADGLPCGLEPNLTCLPGSLCDSYLSKCKRHPGSSCVNSTECATGSICVRGVCKVDLYKDCFEFPSECITGTSCDAANQCKLLLKALCNYTVQDDSCPAGALCINDSICTCDERYTTEVMFGCTPLVGRVNGRCLLGEEKCSVPGAECPDGSTVCSCKQGFGVDFHTFTCTGVTSSAVAEEPVNYVALFFVWVSIIALLIVLLIVTAYVYRVSAVHKKCDVMAEFAERRSQIIELQDQVHTLLEEEQVVRTLSAMSMTSNSRTAVEHQDQEHTLLEEEQTDTLLKEKEAGTLL